VVRVLVAKHVALRKYGNDLVVIVLGLDVHLDLNNERHSTENELASQTHLEQWVKLPG